MIRYRFSLRTLLIVTTTMCGFAVVVAYREQQRLALIRDVMQRGGSIVTSRTHLPGVTGEVVEVSIPYSSYISKDFPTLKRLGGLKKFELTDLQTERVTAASIVITNEAAIRDFADRSVLTRETAAQ